MPVTELINSAGSLGDPEAAAEVLYASLKDRPRNQPGFFFFRVVWVGPSQVMKTLNATAQASSPGLEACGPVHFLRAVQGTSRAEAAVNAWAWLATSQTGSQRPRAPAILVVEREADFQETLWRLVRN